MRENQTLSEPHQWVAAEVRAEMARQRVSQQTLAGAVGISQAAISRRITGEVPFDVTELARVAEVLGVPAAQFLDAGKSPGSKPGGPGTSPGGKPGTSPQPVGPAPTSPPTPSQPKSVAGSGEVAA
jgi:hypothetical protein